MKGECHRRVDSSRLKRPIVFAGTPLHWQKPGISPQLLPADYCQLESKKLGHSEPRRLFVEHYRYGESDERVEGAQMRLGDAWIMLTSARPGLPSIGGLRDVMVSCTTLY
jgi:hypothetical protein